MYDKKTGTPKSKMVLARRNQNGTYSPQNCYWRLARSKQEIKFGIKDSSAKEMEPDTIELTSQQQKQRNNIKTDKELRIFDIWARLLWRTKNS